MSNKYNDALNSKNVVDGETDVPDGSLLVIDGRICYVRGDHDGAFLKSLAPGVHRDWKRALKQQGGDRRLAALSLMQEAVVTASEYSDENHDVEKKDGPFHLSCRITMAVDMLVDILHVVTLEGETFKGKVE